MKNFGAFNIKLIGVVFLSGIALASSVNADQKSDEQTIRANYAALDKLSMKHDWNGMEKYIAQGCKFKTSTGTHTWDEIKKSLESLISKATSSTDVTTIKSIKFNKLNAIVITLSSTKDVFVNPKTKEKVVFTDNSTNRETWMKTSSGWKIRLSETQKSDPRINGKTPEQFRKEQAAKAKKGK